MKRINGILALVPVLAAGIVLSGPSTAGAQTVVEGTVEWARQASLGIPVTGIVARVAIVQGDRVEEGQELVHLERGPFDAAVDAAQAQVVRLDPDVAEARREFERAEDMYDRTLISEHDLELVRIALARVEAEAAYARAMLRLAELDRVRSVLRAPFAAVVIERGVEAGEVVNAAVENVPLVVLGDPSRLVARARLQADALSGWTPGLDVTVLIAERRIAGKVRHVSLVPVGNVGNEPAYAVDVEFSPDTDIGVRIGQRVNIERR